MLEMKRLLKLYVSYIIPILLLLCRYDSYNIIGALGVQAAVSYVLRAVWMKSDIWNLEPYACLAELLVRTGKSFEILHECVSIQRLRRRNHEPSRGT